LLASGSAGLRTVIGASIVPGVAVLVLAYRAVEGGRGRQRAVEVLPDATPLPPSTVIYRPLPPPALLAIAFFYLLRMPDTLIILRSQQLGVPVAVVPPLGAAVLGSAAGGLGLVLGWPVVARAGVWWWRGVR